MGSGGGGWGWGGGGVMPPREGGCLAGFFESLIICSLWYRVVKLMAKWHWASTRGFYGGPNSHWSVSHCCIIISLSISSEMLIGWT